MSHFENIAVVVNRNSWFYRFAKQLVSQINKQTDSQASLFTEHKEVPNQTQIVFLLSYFSIVNEEFIDRFKHVLVVHESNLPKGKGWAPLFWQVIEGKDKIPVVLFEASRDLDSGPIWLKDSIQLEGHELHDELRLKQANVTKKLCINFLKNYKKLSPKLQVGEESSYPRRNPDDSKLDPDKTIREQFELLRTVNNEDFPAYFELRDHKYILKICKND